ncbi:MAG: hypothetical protein KDA28_00030, partial [Phycisphaerales bacterium]|nr:hypothetical protein [Phycisphaerales bacterium]
SAHPEAMLRHGVILAVVGGAALADGESRILFTSLDDGHVWSVTLFGDEPLNITEVHGWGGAHAFPSGSHDGRFVVLCRYPSIGGWETGEAGDLILCDRDGPGVVVLTDTPGIDEREPSFLPDDMGVLYSRNSVEAPGTYELWHCDLQTFEHTKVDGPTDLMGVMRSPVDDVTYAERAGQIWTLEDGNVSTGSGGGGAVEIDPSPRPIGTGYAFSSDRGGTREIHVVDELGIVRRITDLDDCLHPAWSPDERFLVFEREGVLLLTEPRPTFTPEVFWDQSAATQPRWLPAACPADFNSDGRVDIFDVIAFLAAFADNHFRADMTRDGIFDIFDVLEYLRIFEHGCETPGS